MEMRIMPSSTHRRKRETQTVAAASCDSRREILHMQIVLQQLQQLLVTTAPCFPPHLKRTANFIVFRKKKKKDHVQRKLLPTPLPPHNLPLPLRRPRPTQPTPKIQQFQSRVSSTRRREEREKKRTPNSMHTYLLKLTQILTPASSTPSTSSSKPSASTKTSASS